MSAQIQEKTGSGENCLARLFPQDQFREKDANCSFDTDCSDYLARLFSREQSRETSNDVFSLRMPATDDSRGVEKRNARYVS